ncbi:MAG: hypothetical protein D9V46_04180 [Deltaproteobacteria bacterium]|uniref:hypothetical protein n=1 Tax=Hydrosulfovibrio ferrireducens TaxID=2934181 RepID=UPI00122B5489|nr:MAG: hypothetical protein D9V46_04180 [Deltaproteobacteria bacterium]
MNVPIESEDLAMLRHRFGRAIEVSTAYHAFNNHEVAVGPDKTCINEVVRFQVTHTLLITYYSFIYSLFDPSGVNFTEISKSVVPHLPQDGKAAAALAIAEWEEIRTPMSIIRSNIGFHHSEREKGANKGYESYGRIHPLAPELIMQALRVFFRHAAEVFEPREPYGVKPSSSDTDELMRFVLSMKEEIEASPHEDIMELFRSALARA